MKWFKHDCDTSLDPKIKLLKKKFKIEGVGVYFEINRLIAENVADDIEEWGYLPKEYTDNQELLEEEICTETVQRLHDIINYCIEIGLLYKNGERISNPKILLRADRYTEQKSKEKGINITMYVQKLYRICTESVPRREEKEKKEKNETKFKKESVRENKDVTSPPAQSRLRKSELEKDSDFNEKRNNALKMAASLAVALFLFVFPVSAHEVIIRYTIHGKSPLPGIKTVKTTNISEKPEKSKIARINPVKINTTDGITPFKKYLTVKGEETRQAVLKIAEQVYSEDNLLAFDNILKKESGYRFDAVNEIGACGMGQALPCEKMNCPLSEEGIACQTEWIMGYIDRRYGNPIKAWEHHLQVNWY